MNSFELEEHFKTENGLQIVLEEYSSVLDKIDEYSDLALNHKLDNPAVIDKALDVMQGCYGKLQPVLAEAESAKQYQEDRHYHTVREETEATGKKFVSATADREASLVVAPFRRVRNLFDKYVQISEKSISVLQSRSKKIGNTSQMNEEGND